MLLGLLICSLIGVGLIDLGFKVVFRTIRKAAELDRKNEIKEQ